VREMKTVKDLLPKQLTADQLASRWRATTHSGADDSYQLPFRFTGTIDKLTIKLESSRMVATKQCGQSKMAHLTASLGDCGHSQ